MLSSTKYLHVSSSGLSSTYIISMEHNTDVIVLSLQATEASTDVKHLVQGHRTCKWKNQYFNIHQLVSKASVQLKGSFKANE